MINPDKVDVQIKEMSKEQLIDRKNKIVTKKKFIFKSI